jgi:hypothetical protein
VWRLISNKKAQAAMCCCPWEDEHMVSSNADFPSGFSAEEIVGWNFPETNRSLHADRFEEAHIEPLKAFGPDAAPLVECLGSSEIREAFGKYKKWNSRAIVEQSKYRWQSQVFSRQLLRWLSVSSCSFHRR